MIAQVRRIALFVALVVAVVSAWSTTSKAAEPRLAAVPQVTVTNAQTSSATVLEVDGTATCGQSGGQAELFVSGVQVMNFVFGAVTTTVNCATGPVPWHVTITLYSEQWHTGSVSANAILTDSTGSATDSENFYLWV